MLPSTYLRDGEVSMTLLIINKLSELTDQRPSSETMVRGERAACDKLRARVKGD